MGQPLKPRPLILFPILAAAIVALAWLTTTRVPDGRFGLEVSRGSVASGLLPPGLHFHPPAARIALFPAGPTTITGTLRWVSREGASRSTPFRFELDVKRANPESLLPVASSMLAGSDLDSSVTGALASLITGGTAWDGTPQELARRAAPLGVVPESLTLSATSAATHGDNPLRAAYPGPSHPVLLIGLDAADWDLMRPLIDAGQLPNLAALVQRGSRGTLRSMTPTLSPILWTTIATGRRPEDHGIIDFLQRDPATGREVPISRLYRKVKALWNIATDLDVQSLTVAWWATWPAERVVGQMVTDRVAYTLFDIPLGKQLIGATYPEPLLGDLEDLMVDETSITYDEVREIVDVTRAEFERARSLLGTQEGYTDPLAHLVKVLAGTRSYHNVAASLLRREKPRLSMIYFEGIDEVNHRFAHYMPPTMGLVRGESAEHLAAYKNAVPNFYRLQDRMLKDLIEAAGPEADILVVSDHGFANGAERPVDSPPDIEGKPGRWHTLDGILIAAGPSIAKGDLGSNAQLLDIAPTVLALLGLPPATDMPGRVLTELFAPGAEPRPPAVTVQSYDALGEPLQSLETAASSGADSEMMEKLRALGYIQSGGDASAGSGTPTYHVNAGRIFLEKNDLNRAEASFSEARKLAPNFDQALLGLAEVQIKREHPAEAIPLIEEVLSKTKDPQPALFMRAAQVYGRAGMRPHGLEFLGGLRYSGRQEAYRLAAMGALRQADGDADGAIDFYRRALDVSKDAEPALKGLYILLGRSTSLEELAKILEASRGVESQRLSMQVSNWLAIVRERQGRLEEARDLLTQSLGKNPDDVMTLTNLGSMLVDHGLVAEGLPHLEKAYQARPKSFEIVVNLIVGYGKLGRLEPARRLFEEGRAIARPAELKHLYNAMAFTCFFNGARDEAREHLARSLAIDPNQPEARRLQQEFARAGSR